MTIYLTDDAFCVEAKRFNKRFTEILALFVLLRIANKSYFYASMEKFVHRSTSGKNHCNRSVISKYSISFATLDKDDRKICLKISKNMKDNWKHSNAMAVHRNGQLAATFDHKYQTKKQCVELVSKGFLVLP